MKTDFIIGDEIYKTVYSDVSNSPLPIFLGEQLPGIIVKDWYSNAMLTGISLRDHIDAGTTPSIGDWAAAYAEFEYKKYDVTLAYAQGVTWTVNGVASSGIIFVNYGDKIAVNAIIQPAQPGFVTVIKAGNAPYTAGSQFTVTSNVTFSATIQKAYSVTFANTQGITWSFNGNQVTQNPAQVAEGTSIMVRAAVQSGYEGVPVLKAGGVSYSAGSPYAVMSDIVFTASGVSRIPERFEVVLHSGDGGRTEGAGTYDKSVPVTIRAVPDDGYVFVRWSDGSTLRERTVIADSPIELMASFEASPKETGSGIQPIVYVAAALAVFAGGAAVWFFRFRTP